MGDMLLVEHPEHGTLETLTTVDFDDARLSKAIELGQRAVAVFCDEHWVVTGLLRPLPSPQLESDEDTASKPFEINAPRGLILRCGQSTIRLTPDGRVVLRGKNIVSRAREQNHIIGGMLRLN